MKIYQKIRLIRLSNNLSQENIAYELGISQPAYQKIESGKTNISIDKLQKLSEILNYDFFIYLNNKLNDIV
jgi:transcriptional regulator with XRE-family HTH domain